jgi:hypothetical protein
MKDEIVVREHEHDFHLTGRPYIGTDREDGLGVLE